MTTPTTAERTTTVMLGKAEVPVEVTLLGGTLGEPDRHNYVAPVAVARVASAGYWAGRQGEERQHHEVNGVPIRFDATVERTAWGLRLAHLTAYRGDKDFGLGEVTPTIRSYLWTALPALVEGLLADPANAHEAEVAKAQREVEMADRAAQKAREAAREAAVALAVAEERLAALKAL